VTNIGKLSGFFLQNEEVEHCGEVDNGVCSYIIFSFNILVWLEGYSEL